MRKHDFTRSESENWRMSRDEQNGEEDEGGWRLAGSRRDGDRWCPPSPGAPNSPTPPPQLIQSVPDPIPPTCTVCQYHIPSSLLLQSVPTPFFLYGLSLPHSTFTVCPYPILLIRSVPIPFPQLAQSVPTRSALLVQSVPYLTPLPVQCGPLPGLVSLSQTNESVEKKFYFLKESSLNKTG